MPHTHKRKTPSNAVLPSSAESLVQYSNVSAYIIAPYELCNRPLSICTEGVRVLGFPISLEDAKYDRNRFTFNVCFVLDEEDDVKPWRAIVEKTAKFFATIEEQDGLLQREEDLDGLKLAGEAGYPNEGVGIVYTILQGVMEELNNYGETCIRVDDVHTLSLRLSAPNSPPRKVRAWDVPLLIRSLPKPDQWTWDLTLRRIHPHINGVNHIHRIASLADVESKLVKRAVRELLYHDRALLLDIFHFQAIYTTTHNLSHFVKDPEMQEECLKYITTDPNLNPFSDLQDQFQHPTQPTKQSLISLYIALTPGQPLHDFVLSHQTVLSTIDIRRFITYGLIKGFLRRIHKYALSLDHHATTLHSDQPPLLPTDTPSTPPTHPPLQTETSFTTTTTTFTPSSISPTKPRKPSNPNSNTHPVIPDEDALTRDLNRAWKKAALSSGWATPPSDHEQLLSNSAHPSPRSRNRKGEILSSSLSRSVIAEEGGRDEGDGEAERVLDERLKKYLDGRSCLDRVGVEVGVSERKVLERVRSGALGEVVVFCR